MIERQWLDLDGAMFLEQRDTGVAADIADGFAADLDRLDDIFVAGQRRRCRGA